jgi:prepilin-type N-terminal cleavage/methylation domain-containing protein
MESQGFTFIEVLLALFLVTSLSFCLIKQQSQTTYRIRQQIVSFYQTLVLDNETEYALSLTAIRLRHFEGSRVGKAQRAHLEQVGTLRFAHPTFHS